MPCDDCSREEVCPPCPYGYDQHQCCTHAEEIAADVWAEVCCICDASLPR